MPVKNQILVRGAGYYCCNSCEFYYPNYYHYSDFGYAAPDCGHSIVTLCLFLIALGVVGYIIS